MKTQDELFNKAHKAFKTDCCGCNVKKISRANWVCEKCVSQQSLIYCFFVDAYLKGGNNGNN